MNDRRVAGEAVVKLASDAEIGAFGVNQPVGLLSNPQIALSPYSSMVGEVVFKRLNSITYLPIGVVSGFRQEREAIESTRIGDEYRTYVPGRTTVFGEFVIQGSTSVHAKY